LVERSGAGLRASFYNHFDSHPKSKVTDSWFVSKYGMNLYRGCEHACAYCDGRAEKYRVEGDFGRDIQVKGNAPELLREQLSRLKEPGFIFVGGGVCDAYQPAERRYELTRRCLEVIAEHGMPAHVLTKSALVERDLDLLERINAEAGAMVSMSFCSADQRVVDLFEPGCAAVDERFRVLELCRERGIPTGAMLLPLIPLVSDSSQSVEALVARAGEAGVAFALFGGMTLKGGRQQQHFMRVLKGRYPELAERYGAIYTGNKWGHASGDCYQRVDALCRRLLSKHRIPPRIPHRLFAGKVRQNVEVAMLLSHVHYLLKLQGEDRKAYEYAAYRLQGLKEDVADLVESDLLRQVPGVGPVIERMVREVVETGTCAYYTELMSEYT